MLPVEETHVPVSTCLLQVGKELREQGMKYTQSLQQKHQNKFNNIFWFSKSQIPGTLNIPSIPILTSNKHIPQGYYKTYTAQEQKIVKIVTS